MRQSKIFIGTIIVRNLYQKKLAESFKFVFSIQLILLGISTILGFMLAILFGYIFPQFSDALFFILEFGLFYTLLITALSLIIGLALGLSLAIMRVYGGKELYWLCKPANPVNDNLREGRMSNNRRICLCSD